MQISDIAQLPWVGNHASDGANFRKCHTLIISLAEAGDIAGVAKAMTEMDRCGMGGDRPAEPWEVEAYLAMDLD
jgi:hypothetical protein